MAIETDEQLNEALDRVGGDLQAIQDYVGWDFARRRPPNLSPGSLASSALISGGIGAILLRSTPPVTFERLVPFLVLFATILFVIAEPIRNKLRERAKSSDGKHIWMPGAKLGVFNARLTRRPLNTMEAA